MEIVVKNLAELKRPNKNVRLHGDRQIKEYIRSVEMFGQIRPLVIDENNIVLAGNGLLQAFQKMGKDSAECCVVKNLSEKQKKKLMLVDNKIYELGANDQNVFDEILRELDGDIDIPGYDEELLKVLAAGATEAAEKIMNDFEQFNEERTVSMSGGKRIEYNPAPQHSAPATSQNLNNGGEINTENFDDEKFECTCPKCGFKFNR